MADSTNTDGEVDERYGMVVDWSDLTKDRLGAAEVIAQQQQQQQPREEPEAAAEPLMMMSPVLLLFLMRFSMTLAVSRTSRVLLLRRSKH